MRKFEIGLIGVMAFLILSILGMIAISDPEEFDRASLGSKPESFATSESLSKDDTSDTMTHIEDETSHAMTHTTEESSTHSHSVMIPEGTGVVGCEENNECYIPYSFSLKAGHKTIWTNQDVAAHTVTSGTPDGGPDGIFDSGILLSEATFEYVFEETGSYDYYCIVHPWMTGIIKVV